MKNKRERFRRLQGCKSTEKNYVLTNKELEKKTLNPLFQYAASMNHEHLFRSNHRCVLKICSSAIPWYQVSELSLEKRNYCWRSIYEQDDITKVYVCSGERATCLRDTTGKLYECDAQLAPENSSSLVFLWR